MYYIPEHHTTFEKQECRGRLLFAGVWGTLHWEAFRGKTSAKGNVILSVAKNLREDIPDLHALNFCTILGMKYGTRYFFAPGIGNLLCYMVWIFLPGIGVHSRWLA